MAAVFGDENANANLVNVNVKVEVEKTTVLGVKEVATVSPQKSPLKDSPTGPSKSPSRGRSPPTRPALEPSLEAWAASRSNIAGTSFIRNIGPSEREDLPEASVNSRWSRLSRRSSSNRSLSTEQVESARLAQKRNEVKSLMRANERNYRQAIENPQTVTSIAASSRSLNITVPKEFNLSTSNRSVERARHHRDAEDAGTPRRSRAGRSRSQNKAWCPQLTVPRGPHLSTQDRAHSRSCSRSCTPMGTPDRHNHSRSVSSAGSRHSDIPAREIEAIERHNSRMAAGRLASESPMRSARSEISPARTARSRVSASPARSCSDMSICSMQSRISRLSRPRSLSRPCLSTAEIEAMEVEAGRLEMANLLRLNEKNLHKVLGPAKPVHKSERQLTEPTCPELHTERRVRSRSTSLQSSRSSNLQGSRMERLPLREREAVQRHNERLAAAHAMDEAMRSGRGRSSKEDAAVAAALSQRQAVATEKQQRWIRSAPNAVERAQRAKLVAQSVHSDLQKLQRQQLCIFDPATLAAEAEGLDDDEDDDVVEQAGEAGDHGGKAVVVGDDAGEAIDDGKAVADDSKARDGHDHKVEVSTGESKTEGQASEISVGEILEVEKKVVEVEVEVEVEAVVEGDAGQQSTEEQQQQQQQQQQLKEEDKDGNSKGVEEPELTSTTSEVKIVKETSSSIEVSTTAAATAAANKEEIRAEGQDELEKQTTHKKEEEEEEEEGKQEEGKRHEEGEEEAAEAEEAASACLNEVVVVHEEVTTTSTSITLEGNADDVENRAELAAAGVLFAEHEVELLDLEEVEAKA